MRKVVIDETKYEMRGMREITHRACKRVELLIPTLFFDSLDMQTLAGDSLDKRKIINEKKIFAQLLSSPEKLVEFIQMTEFDDSMKDIMAVMLTTDMDYKELIELPQMALMKLVKESKEEIGSYEDFTAGLGINIESNVNSILGAMTEMQKKD